MEHFGLCLFVFMYFGHFAFLSFLSFSLFVLWLVQHCEEKLIGGKKRESGTLLLADKDSLAQCNKLTTRRIRIFSLFSGNMDPLMAQIVAQILCSVVFSTS